MPQVEPLKIYKNGQVHKLCRGPYHDKPAWLPACKFYKRGNPPGTKKLRAWCKKCELTHRSFKRASLDNSKTKTHVPVGHLQWVFVELQQRAGVHKAAAIVGVSMPQFYNLKTGIHTRTRRKHLYNAFVGLVCKIGRASCRERVSYHV